MRRIKKPDLPEGDDGRTIANMNVEGMPWYTPSAQQPGANASGPSGAEGNRPVNEHPAPLLTREESRYYTWGAVKAALLVVGCICAGLVLFILFCQLIWFK